MFVIDTSPKSSIEEGEYDAICVQFVDMGSQYNAKYDKTNREMRFVFELPSRLTKEGMPMTRFFSCTKTWGTNSKFYNFVRDWFGPSFIKKAESSGGVNPKDLLGKHAKITINSEGYIDFVEPPSNEKVQPVNPMLMLTLDDDFDQSIFDELHEKWQQRIAQSPEFAELVKSGKARPIGAATENEPLPADVPF